MLIFLFLISFFAFKKEFLSVIIKFLTLKKIADALQVSVGDLIGENATFLVNPFLKSKERKFVKKNKTGARLYLLSHHDPAKQMDPFILHFDKM